MYKVLKGNITMIDVILNTLVYILAIYGLVEIIKTVIYIMEFTNLNENGIYIIIGAKNQEKQICGALRSILFKVMYGKEDVIKKVILTDLDSSDKTMQKLEEFKKENEDIKVTTWRECKNIIDMIDES